MLGCEATRLSMHDSHGGEHFAIVPMNGSGKENRLLRRRALEMIDDHIQAGEEPGEVIVPS